MFCCHPHLESQPHDVESSKYARSPAILADLLQVYVSGFLRIPVADAFGLAPCTCLKSLMVSDHALVF